MESFAIFGMEKGRLRGNKVSNLTLEADMPLSIEWKYKMDDQGGQSIRLSQQFSIQIN